MEKKFSVVEADEYDLSFMNLFPDTIVLTSMDADHLDIYENQDSLVKAFKDFTNLLRDYKSNCRRKYQSFLSEKFVIWV